MHVYVCMSVCMYVCVHVFVCVYVCGVCVCMALRVCVPYVHTAVQVSSRCFTILVI